MQSRSRWLVGGAAGLALLAVALAYRHDLRAPRGRVATGATRLQTDRGPIEVAVRGEGPPVLLVHAAGGGWDQGMDIGGSLVDRGLRVIAVQRRPRPTLRPDALERIAAPTLAISVADDLYGTDANAREAARRIPGARYLGWPQGGHVFVSHEAEVTDAVAAFVLAYP